MAAPAALLEEECCALVVTAGVEVEGALVETAAEEPEPLVLVLVERPCRANSQTPANSTTATRAI